MGCDAMQHISIYRCEVNKNRFRRLLQVTN